MKGMGTYTPFENELSHLSVDEINELYLSGDLDKMYEEFERTTKAKVYNWKTKKQYKAKVLMEDEYIETI